MVSGQKAGAFLSAGCPARYGSEIKELTVSGNPRITGPARRTGTETAAPASIDNALHDYSTPEKSLSTLRSQNTAAVGKGPGGGTGVFLPLSVLQHNRRMDITEARKKDSAKRRMREEDLRAPSAHPPHRSMNRKITAPL